MIDRHDAGAVRTLTLAQPATLNAFSGAGFDALTAELTEAADDDAVHCVVVTGAGRAFSAGLDLTSFDADAIVSDAHGFQPCARAVSAFPKPLLGGVNGLAVGFGVTFLLHCDLVVAADVARFRLPFTQLGLAPQAAAHMLLTGTWFGATEAAAAGLVWRVVDAAGLAEAVADVAREIATAPLAALVATKTALVAGRAAAVDRALRFEQEQYRRLLAGPDVAAALERFRSG